MQYSRARVCCHSEVLCKDISINLPYITTVDKTISPALQTVWAIARMNNMSIRPTLAKNKQTKWKCPPVMALWYPFRDNKSDYSGIRQLSLCRFYWISHFLLTYNRGPCRWPFPKPGPVPPHFYSRFIPKPRIHAIYSRPVWNWNQAPLNR